MTAALGVVIIMLAVISWQLNRLDRHLWNMHRTIFRLFFFGSRSAEAHARGIVAEVLLAPGFDTEWREAAGIKEPKSHVK